MTFIESLVNNFKDTFSKMEPMNFVENLSYMGTGMLCIIIVIGAIILVTMLLSTLTAKIAAKKAKKQ